MIGNKSFHFIFLKLGRFQYWYLPLKGPFNKNEHNIEEKKHVEQFLTEILNMTMIFLRNHQ